MHPSQSEKGTHQKQFAGFQHLTANYIYCPNQFFDVCLAHHSRGVVRLVSYILRQTLGWLDKNGEPVEQNVTVSYQELVTRAAISRGAIRPSIEEAIAAGFIICSRHGRKGDSGCTAQTAQYQLHWDTGRTYLKNPSDFCGFYAGEGNRTPIPNAFFDHVVVSEPLAVSKVVGTVLRHTVGHQNQFGGRRSEAPLSYSFIQDYANLKHRPTLAEAIRRSIETGYITRVVEGRFDPSGKQNRPASYAVHWLTPAANWHSSSKTEPVNPEQFRNRTGRSSETEPAIQFKNRTHKKTEFKNTHKQHIEYSAANFSDAMALLREAGFDDKTATKLSQLRTEKEIKQQLDWLPLRNIEKNRLGFLRRAIEENWEKPIRREAVRPIAKRNIDKHDHQKTDFKQQRQQQRELLVSRWNSLDDKTKSRFYQQAIEKATSEFIRSRLRKQSVTDQQPPVEVIQLLGSRQTPTGESF